MPLLGAIPIFIDVEADTFNLDPAKLEDTLQTGNQLGINVKGIMSVGLFGQPANMKPIKDFASQKQLMGS
jgi:dTDP-4-amino-4,6-dideoxygalactose transaminase